MLWSPRLLSVVMSGRRSRAETCGLPQDERYLNWSIELAAGLDLICPFASCWAANKNFSSQANRAMPHNTVVRLAEVVTIAVTTRGISMTDER